MTARRIIPYVLLVVVAIIVGFGALEGMSRLLFPRWHEFAAHRFLGYVNVPGFGRLQIGAPGFDGYFSQNNGDFRIRITVNQQGLREPRPASAADGKVWAVGDSFTFGWGVEWAETYPHVAAEAAGTDVYNFANPGTDVCGYQASLARFLDRYAPRAVVVGLTLENDIRAANCDELRRRAAETADADDGTPTTFAGLKLWLMRYSALYNVFATSIKRIPAALGLFKSLGLIAAEHVAHYGFPREEMAGRVRTTVGEIRRLRDMMPAVPFVVVIIPGRTELLHGDPFFVELRQEVAGELAANGIEHIDPVDQFEAAGFEDIHFEHDGHWSAHGHAIVGALVADWLRKRVKP